MGVRLDTETFCLQAAELRAAGVSRVEWADDGSTAALEFFEERDTIPCPAPSGAYRIVSVTTCDTDPHPELMPDDERNSDRIARENGWLREQLVAGAGIGRR